VVPERAGGVNGGELVVIVEALAGVDGHERVVAVTHRGDVQPVHVQVRRLAQGVAQPDLQPVPGPQPQRGTRHGVGVPQHGHLLSAHRHRARGRVQVHPQYAVAAAQLGRHGEGAAVT